MKISEVIKQEELKANALSKLQNISFTAVESLIDQDIDTVYGDICLDCDLPSSNLFSYHKEFMALTKLKRDIRVYPELVVAYYAYRVHFLLDYTRHLEWSTIDIINMALGYDSSKIRTVLNHPYFQSRLVGVSC